MIIHWAIVFNIYSCTYAVHVHDGSEENTGTYKFCILVTQQKSMNTIFIPLTCLMEHGNTHCKTLHNHNMPHRQIIIMICNHISCIAWIKIQDYNISTSSANTCASPTRLPAIHVHVTFSQYLLFMLTCTMQQFWN